MAQANSFVEDLVIKVDHTLDQLHVNIAQSAPSRVEPSGSHAAIKDSIHHLSTSSTKSRKALHDTRVIRAQLQDDSISNTHHEQLLEWILVGKATSQTYGIVLDALLHHILPLDAEIDYWLRVRDSVRYTALYSLQTAPLRLWSWSSGVYHEVRTNENLAQDSWNDFYSIVRSVVRTRSVSEAKASIALPSAVVREEIQAKLDRLQRAKSAYAASIGLLLSNGFDTSQGLQGLKTNDDVQDKPWRSSIANAVGIMESVFSIDAQDKDWHASLDAVSASSTSPEPSLPDVKTRLIKILDTSLPSHTSTNSRILHQFGRPSVVVRYWAPAVALFFSSSTILRIVLARRAALSTWISDTVTTAIAFWQNWVVEPARNLIATIRHDDAAEVSLMSRASLDGDRASLERMVVDFAIDNPGGSTPLSASDVDAVRAAVRAGDLTPVLRAYEQDLKAPLTGSLRGSLVRALLIQIQKTKVDVELAIKGIDSLLQSQQLVFGLASLTPGVLVSVGAARYAAAVLDTRSGRAQGAVRDRAAAHLRGIDRVLVRARRGAAAETLGFEPFGLLVVDAVLLRRAAAIAMPRDVFDEFLGDFADLIDVKAGINSQTQALERIRSPWGYGRHLY